MCYIVSVHLTKNGSNQSVPCIAIPTDTIIVDLVFVGESTDNGILVYGHVAIKVPDGTTRDLYSDNFKMITGGNDAYVTVDLSTYGIGNYKIINAWIEDAGNGAPRCEGIPNVGYCQTLTVSVPCIQPSCGFILT